MDFKKKMKKFFTLTRKADGGFTLVELVVVIAILAILAGITVPAYGNYVENAKMATDKQTLATMNTAFTVACMDKGEYDMTALPFTPTASNLNTGVTVSHYNETFQGYFGGGAFQYYDVLGFDSSRGVFVANTIAAIKEALKEAWNSSNVKNGEDVLNMLSATFDQFSSYFSGNNTLFPDGFSLDGVLATMPEEVKNAFGFGSYDITEEQQEALLNEYVEGYADMSDEEKAEWKENNQETVNNIKGNAYVMNIANAANSGVTAQGIKEDVAELLDALATAPTDQEKLWELYKEKNPDSTYSNLQELYSACDNEQLKVYGLTPEVLVAVAATGVKNDSGISTLGSMYALAAGYLNSEEYKKAGENTLDSDITEFPNVLAAMQHPGFDEYLNGKKDENGNRITAGTAVNDVDAYLNYMKYVSANGVDMGKNNAFTELGSSIGQILGGSN